MSTKQKFPRKDRYPRQYLDAWTQCGRCKTPLLCYDEQTTFYVDKLPYCILCYEKIKKSSL